MNHWWTEPTDLVTIFTSFQWNIFTWTDNLYRYYYFRVGNHHMGMIIWPIGWYHTSSVYSSHATEYHEYPRVRWFTTTKSSHLPYTEGPPISIASFRLQISLVILIRLNTTAVRTYQVPYLVAYWLPESIFAGRVTRIQYYEAKVIPSKGKAPFEKYFP